MKNVDICSTDLFTVSFLHLTLAQLLQFIIIMWHKYINLYFITSRKYKIRHFNKQMTQTRTNLYRCATRRKYYKYYRLIDGFILHMDAITATKLI